MTKLFTFLITLLCFTVSAYSQTLPKPDHIIILIEENEADSAVICPTCAAIAPWLNQLASDTNTAVFTNMNSIEHPSQPNYIEYFSGDNQGVTGLFTGDDSVATWPFTTPNLARQLMDSGYTFKTYSLGLPYVGFEGVRNGKYVRRHNPVTNWQGTGPNQVPDSLNQPFSAFPSDYGGLPTIAYVVPSTDSDMHDSTGNYPITVGDYWAAHHLDSLKHWVLTHNSLLVVTWDESNAISAINHIPTMFYGPMVQGGNYNKSESLYSQLRTFEDIYHLGHAGAAADSLPIDYCWRANYHYQGINNSIDNKSFVKVFPNPSYNNLTIEGIGLQETNYTVTITDIAGHVMAQVILPASKKLEINTSTYPQGLYFYHLLQNGQLLQSDKVVVAR